jgi:DNA-binding MarR family transcriptional regulator
MVSSSAKAAAKGGEAAGKNGRTGPGGRLARPGVRAAQAAEAEAEPATDEVAQGRVAPDGTEPGGIGPAPGSAPPGTGAGAPPGTEDWEASIPRLATAGRALALGLISLQTAIARAIGIHPTDVAILAHLQPMPGEKLRTPGDLAKLTGLTSGAITGVIDRLEREGYVRRVRDPQDRRKIFIELSENLANFDAVAGPMLAELHAFCGTFSVAELGVITDYLEGFDRVIQRAISGMHETS